MHFCHSDEWMVSQEVVNGINKFTSLIFGLAREQSLNAESSIVLRQMVGKNEELTFKSKVDNSRLPSCRDNPIPHADRITYRLVYHERADKAIVCGSNPYDPELGWKMEQETWSQCGLVALFLLSYRLLDLLEKAVEEVEDEQERGI